MSEKARRREERLAASFRRDDEMERLLAREKFLKLPPVERIAVGHYASARDAYQHLAKGEARQ